MAPNLLTQTSNKKTHTMQSPQIKQAGSCPTHQTLGVGATPPKKNKPHRQPPQLVRATPCCRAVHRSSLGAGHIPCRAMQTAPAPVFQDATMVRQLRTMLQPKQPGLCSCCCRLLQHSCLSNPVNPWRCPKDLAGHVVCHIPCRACDQHTAPAPVLQGAKVTRQLRTLLCDF